jgi:hypothetical protein
LEEEKGKNCCSLRKRRRKERESRSEREILELVLDPCNGGMRDNR